MGRYLSAVFNVMYKYSFSKEVSKCKKSFAGKISSKITKSYFSFQSIKQ